jgi:hypothetical protein
VEISKIVPARKVKFEASSCKLDWLEMNQQFRDIRSKGRHKMNKCDWCSHAFVDGEMMALAIANNGNKVLCQSCGQQLIESGK